MLLNSKLATRKMILVFKLDLGLSHKLDIHSPLHIFKLIILIETEYGSVLFTREVSTTMMYHMTFRVVSLFQP